MTIEEKIKKLIKNQGYSLRQFSKEIDIPYTTFITMLQNGINKSNVNNVKKVLTGLGLSIDDLGHISGQEPIIDLEHGVNNIPLIGRIAAGYPIFAEENIEDYFRIDSSINADFCLRIRGDSMIEAGIKDNDIVFIKKQETLENGQIGAILINEEATLKTFYKDKDTIILQPANKDYHPMIYTHGNIRILGKLVAVLNLRN
ncbi:MAG: transcriptional repressor LexA [Tissierellia bacterium]|nr:transcriptional repressor LexA [Tissierellia bacterium]